MSMIRMTAADGADRRPSICIRSIMGAVATLLVTIGILAGFCVFGVADAAVTPGEFGGRWLSATQKLTIDVSRCGNGWCGVEVTNGSTCGRTVLRVDAGEQDDESVRFSGRLQLTPESAPYGVEAIVLRRSNGLAVTIAGHTGGSFQMFRRSFDFEAQFVRIDDPVCRPDAKVSDASR